MGSFRIKRCQRSAHYKVSVLNSEKRIPRVLVEFINKNKYNSKKESMIFKQEKRIYEEIQRGRLL